MKMLNIHPTKSHWINLTLTKYSKIHFGQEELSASLGVSRGRGNIPKIGIIRTIRGDLKVTRMMVKY